MLVVFAVALLIVAAAVVILFAMLAELATRVPERSGPARDPQIRPLEEARLGHAPTGWPAGLPDPEHAVLLVLSTVCNSCRDVAEQLVVDPGHADWTGMAVIVSSASRENGEEFIRRYRLTGFPVHIDAGGAWLTEEFGVHTSPGALVFRSGKLISAHVFNNVSSLRSALETVDYENTRQEQRAQKEAV